MFKRSLVILMVAAAATTSVSAKNFNTKLQEECRYILGDKDNGRYYSEAHGFSLGVVAGVKDALPADQRNSLYKRSLGYISNNACYRALHDRSSDSFIIKYRRAVLNLLKK